MNEFLPVLADMEINGINIDLNALNDVELQFKEEFGQRATFPQVLINGSRIGGCTESIKYLRENSFI